MEDARATQLKISKSCDDCKARKVRCATSGNPDSRSCMACTKRHVQCHFSPARRRAWRNLVVLSSIPASRVSPSASIAHTQNLPSSTDEHTSPRDLTESTVPPQPLGAYPPKLYIDHLLEHRNTSGRRRNESSVLKAHDYYVGSSGLAFFSEKRISSISDRLGHSKFRDHIETLATVISARMNRNCDPFSSAIKFSSPPAVLQISTDSAKSYINEYFTHIHPLYPFLDRKEFEEKAFSTSPVQHQQGSPHFSALYHSVLALGCQYQDGGTFDPGKGRPWELYRISLGLLSEILLPKESLVDLQAVTAMAIFAHNSSCIQIGNMLTVEAARMAQLLGFNKATSQGDSEASYYRTFWVIYILEKTVSFACGRASILADYDIGAPIPETPDALFQGFDWFLTMARFSRLISKAYEVLFSISATLNSTELSHAAIDTVNDDLECWRKSIRDGFRPGDPFRPMHFGDHSSLSVALRVHYYYYSVVIALSRISLHVDTNCTSYRSTKSKETLMNAARVIIELTTYIDTEAHAPIWVLGSMPLSALFILFDFVVHNPSHPETQSNLSLLGIAAGYFYRLEYASGGSLPSSLLSDFAHIARQYVQDSASQPKVNTAGAEDLDQSSRQPTIANPDQQSALESVPVFNSNDESLVGLASTDSLTYPVNDMSFPRPGDLLDGVDVMDFFDNIMMDYRKPTDWVDLMQETGT